MGCCFSKKRKKSSAAVVEDGRWKAKARDPPPPPSPEEEKVKEVLSETPNTQPRSRAEPLANAGPVKQEKEERAKDETRVADLGRDAALAADEKSEIASESSAATTAAGPERSPGKPARKRAVSGDLRLARRDRAVAVSGVGCRSARGSPSPPPRRDPGERSGRRSPSPAAKRPADQRRAATCSQRKPPVPSRPCGRVSPRRAKEAPSPLPLPPLPQPEPEEDALTNGGEDGVPDAGAGAVGGEGKESLENPLVSLECFIFL